MFDFTKANEQINDLEKILKPAKKILKIIFIKLRHKIEIQKFDLKICLGLKNSITLGTIYGSIWALFYYLYGTFTHYFKMNTPTLNIDSSSHENNLSFEVECIITTRIRHIISAILRFGFVYFEIKKITKKKTKNK